MNRVPSELSPTAPSASTCRPSALSLRRKVLFGTLVVAGGLLAAEGAMRGRESIRVGSATPGDTLYIEHPLLGRIPRPGARMIGRNTAVVINSLGLRGPEIPAVKPDGTFRIACLGGSTTFGTHCSSNDTTWPARLQERLRASRPDLRIEVVNAGVPGYTVSHSRINLEERVLALDPDLIVVYHAANDLSAIQKLYCSSRQVDNKRATALTRVAEWLSRHSLLYRKVAKNVNVQLAGRDTARRLDHLPEPAVAEFRSILSALVDDCRRAGIPVVLCTVATHFRADQPPAVRRRAAGTSLYYNRYLTVDALIDAFERFNSAIREVAVQAGAPCADVFSAVPGTPVYFGDSIHFSDEGTRLVADCLHETLAASGLVSLREPGGKAQVSRAAGPASGAAAAVRQ